MSKPFITLLGVIMLCISAGFAECGESNTVILSVECRNIRRSGAAAKLNPAFEDSHMKWLIKCSAASATKVSESPTGVQWRIQPMKKDPGRVVVQYRDKFGQQHHAGGAIDPANSSMELSMRRMVNRLQIGMPGGRVTAVYFAESGKKNSLGDADKCVPGGGTYDFPAIWQGPQKAWSLYIRTSSGVKEIPASGNFFGLWGDFTYSEQGNATSFTAKSNCKKLNSLP